MVKDLGNKAAMAQNLRRLMAERNISAKEFSKVMGYPYTTLLSWLKADNYPRIDRIEEMAKYFGVKKSVLIEEQTEKPTAADDGLSENVRMLIDFAKSVPEDKAEMVLRVMRSIVETD